MDMYRSASAGALAILVTLIGAAPAAADSVHPGTFTGEGFDACTAPSSATMNAWLASPYRSVGVYFGGSNRACLQPNLTAAWVTQQTAAGWHLIPLYVGKQASCTNSNKPDRINNAQAAADGRANAQDAVVQARAIGLARDSVLVFDMEAYDTDDPACRAGVVTFMSAWTARLHDYGYLSGFYSSMGSGMADMIANYNTPGFVRPDYVDFAKWDGISTVSDPAIPASYWSPKRRIKQYVGDHNETHGGVTINIDNDVLDVTPLPATRFGDFTGNGWSDLLARTGGAITIHAGNGTTLQSPATFGSGWGGMNALLRIGDWNADGREDVVAREASTGNVFFYPGTGAGLGTRKQILTAVARLRELTPIGDLTGNTYPDLLAVDTADNGLYLYPGRAGVTFGARVKVGGTGWNTMSELAGVGDFDRDGFPDLVARVTSSGLLYFYAGRAGNTFAARRQLGGSWGGMRNVTGVGDADRDGFTDVMAVNATGTVYRWSGNGTGLRPGVRVATGFGSRNPAF
ncbi:glycoside hydrolase domain-containing protein [Actinoplanes sp. NPDC051633]|uniref:glycoside hydrolase domain-containing protein n=1 Tax=Actinoplanes sp. NPDC051633 TaxID=3155670 RepID=UPI003431BB11